MFFIFFVPLINNYFKGLKNDKDLVLVWPALSLIEDFCLFLCTLRFKTRV